MRKYDHNDIEKKWADIWEQEQLYKIPNNADGKKNHYTLVEFSYPSGNLHVGHWYAFSVPDMYARYMRMRGYNSLYPMGFDSFGLPAENAAIKHGKDPKDWTYKNMEYMRTQLRSMGASFDWSREVATSDPDYYRWTQWMFNQFYKNDLAYRANTKVNWCPKDQTVLANEQVVDGTCDRCGTEVVQKDQDQWMLRITRFADALVDDLDGLQWNDSIKEAQKSWIGRSEGSEISFKLKGESLKEEFNIDIFTTRADTLFGATYVVLAPEHPLVSTALLAFTSGVTNKSEIEEYIESTKRKSDLERQQNKNKTGVEVKGIKAINPANGEELPVWIADYVLGGYGTGAVMAVPAHDERDADFARKYDLGVKDVIIPSIIDHKNPHVDGWTTITRNNIHAIVYDPATSSYLTLKWKDYDWHTIVLGGVEEGEDIVECAAREVREETGYKNLKFIKHLGSPVQSRYAAAHKEQNRVAYSTGLYFELVNDEQDIVAEEEKNLFDVVWVHANDFDPSKMTNVELPIWFDRIAGRESVYTEDGVLINSGDFNGLTSLEARAKITDFVGGKIVRKYRLRDWGISRQRYWGVPIPIVYDPEGRAHAIPDEHLPWLLPEDVDHTPDGTAPLARSKELFERTENIFGKGWKPEVETMDTFVDSSWYFYRYLDSKNETVFCSKEAQKDFMPIDIYFGGAEHTTMHLLYSRFWVKALHSLGLVDEIEPYKERINRSLILGPDGNKMSKSKGNVVDPDEVVGHVGADTVRMYLAFIGPYGATSHYPWDPNGVVGIRRFIERVWRVYEKVQDEDVPQVDALLHKTIKKVTEDIERYKFNTAISAMMIYINEVEKIGQIGISQYKTLVRLFAVFAPFVSEEIWRDMLGVQSSVHLEAWPVYDESKIIESTYSVAIQINGKLRGTLDVSAEASEEDVWSMAISKPEIYKWIDGKEIVKKIFVKGKILNLVVK